jgi:hypothetical protein
MLVLAACGGGPTGDPARDLQWRTSIRGNEVHAIAFDRTGAYVIQRVSLVGPEGQIIPAREMTRESQGGSGSGVTFGVGGVYGSRGGGGVGLGTSVPLDTDTAPLLERRTVAIIPLADPERYRSTASQWRIEVDMVAPGGMVRQATVPAPTS